MKKNRNINEDKYDDIIQRQNERRFIDRNIRDYWKFKLKTPYDDYEENETPEMWKRRGVHNDLERYDTEKREERNEKAREYLKSKGVDFQEFARLIEDYDKSRGKILKEWQGKYYNVNDYGQYMLDSAEKN